MIKIIQKTRYNTETAKEVHAWTNGGYGSLDYREKPLYLTKNGAWFMYHCGGPLTDMAVSIGSNSTSGSENIEPVSAIEALDFLEEYDGIEAIEEYFSAEIQDA